MDDCIAVILAAGEGTRMKSDTPKVLHRAAGQPLAQWVVDAAHEATGRKPIMVYGSGGEAVPDYFQDQCLYAKQEKRLGSGHAVIMAAEALRQSGCKYCLVIAGDMPLIRTETLVNLLNLTKSCDYSALLLSAAVDDPTGYGRIVRDEMGAVTGIVEQKDATDAQKQIKEVNSSVYCFNTEHLFEALDHLRPNNVQKEYYLTDCISILYTQGLNVGALPVGDTAECMGVNDRVQLAAVTRIVRERILEEIMLSGVTVMDPPSTYVEKGVTVGKDTFIYPGVILEGQTEIGSGCVLYQGSRIKDSRIGSGTVIQNSVILESSVGENTQIGPYAYLRPGSDIGSNCRIGDFVEIKNSAIDDRSKVSHLTYVGDGKIGQDVNIGCGVVFVNYDGQKKFITEVGDGVFIGCNTNLISPVKVGSGAYIAAGTTVTKDVPEDALCIGRARELVKEGWAKGRYKIKKDK